MGRRTIREPRAVLVDLAACLGAIGLALAVGACRTIPADCKYDTTERCLWDAGITPKGDGNGNGNGNGNDEADGSSLDSDPALGDPANTAQIDAALTEMVDIIAAGLEWALVDEQARALCSEAPTGPEQDPDQPASASEAWTCPVPRLMLGEQPLTLEASTGVLSLSAAELGDAESAELFELAQRRFDGWCASENFKEIESDGLSEFYRCSLADGPYLVIARFPRDPKAAQWQVSIAIVDAG